MALVTIPSLHRKATDSPEKKDQQEREWCAALEAGDILYFPQTPIKIDPSDLAFLLDQQQTNSTLHKNIAYKPGRDVLSGVDNKSADAQSLGRLHSILRHYSESVASFLSGFLAPYQGRWQLDYASFRPQEEQGRDLPLRRRNDLLHTDAFPTRPTHGARILRFFNNIHPTRTRDWVTTEPFSALVRKFAPLQIALPVADTNTSRALKSFAGGIGLTKAIPSLKRSPYDEFMMRFHNFLKENAEFQTNCTKEYTHFAPGSSWMVYTETVPHAVLAGQYALEQTCLVSPDAMVDRASAPVAVLEAMTGTRLR